LVKVADVDSFYGEISIILSVDYGVITIPLLTPFGEEVRGHNITIIEGTGVDDSSINLKGSLEALNQVLYSMLYTPPLYWSSDKSGLPATLSLYADDLGHSGEHVCFSNTNDFSSNGDSTMTSCTIGIGPGLTAMAEVLIIVTQGGVNHRPTIRLPGAHYRLEPCESPYGEADARQLPPRELQCERILSVDSISLDEDHGIYIHGVQINDVDEDQRITGIPGILRVHLSALHGTLSLDSQRLQVLERTNNSLVVLGTLSQLNQGLESLHYQPFLNYYGEELVSVYVIDTAYGSLLGGDQWANETIPLQVNPLEDPPILHIPQGEELLDILEDKRLVIIGISIESPDFTEKAEGKPSYISNPYPSFQKQPEWNETNYNTQTSGMVRLEISCECYPVIEIKENLLLMHIF
jgi:hypothetical protein